MLIIMMGLPKSGKSTIANKIVENSDITLINPEILYPDNIKELSRSENLVYKLSAWDASFECAMEELNTKDVLFDTCGNSYEMLNELILKAKVCGHKIYIIFKFENLKECKKRAGIEADSIKWDDYLKKFKSSLPKLYKKVDKLITIRNVDDIAITIDKINGEDRILQS